MRRETSWGAAMVVLRIRIWHMLLLVAACAAFLAAFLYRRGVYDPTYARLRQVRYASADGKIAAIRELIDSDMRELIDSEASLFDVIQTLLIALGDADPAVRGVAARAMAVASERNARLKEPDESLAGPVKAALTEALRDPDATVRLRAASSLGQLKVRSNEGLAILLHAARTRGQPLGRFRAAGDADDRAEALWVLGFAYRDEPEALPPILEATNDRDPQVRISGLIAMNCYLRTSDGNWYRRSADFTVPEPVAEALLARLEDEDDHVRRRAADVLGQLGQKMARRVVPLLMRDLDAPQPTPVWIVRALGEFGLEADQALPALRALADDTSRAGALRFAAQKAVEAIDKVSRKFHEVALPDLITNLGDDDPEMRTIAAAVLARHGPRAKAAVPALKRALDDPDPNVQRAATAALGAIE
jgi:HEAT repeat protein